MFKKVFTKTKIKSLLLFNYNRFFVVTKFILEKKLKSGLKSINTLEIQDSSGGCGDAFSIKIKSSDFKGKSLIEQHRIVNEILKDEVKQIHSLVLKTSAE
jgi:stress-induced morphogen